MQAVTTQTPAVVPYTVQRTAMVPETMTVQRPVQMTRYVEEVVTERVPVTTQSTRREVLTRKVPVVVQRPSKRIVTEKVPVEKVRYVPYVVTKKTPITKVTYQEEEVVEPYDVQVLSYVSETSEVQVPKRVSRWVPITTTRLVPETQYVPRVLVESTTWGPVGSRLSSEAGAVVSGSAIPRVYESTPSISSPQTTARLPLNGESQIIYGTTVVTERPAESVLQSPTEAAKPVTELEDVEAPKPPAAEDNRSGTDDVNAPEKAASDPTENQTNDAEADKVPSLEQGG
jgi:hypothetical protein